MFTVQEARTQFVIKISLKSTVKTVFIGSLNRKATFAYIKMEERMEIL